MRASISAKQKQERHEAERKSKLSNKLREALPGLQLLFGELAVLFVAGIVVPSLLRFFGITRGAMGADPLHQFTTGRLTFTYSLWTLGCAVLGAMFGAVVAWAINAPGRLASVNIVDRMLQTAYSIRLASESNGRSYINKAALIHPPVAQTRASR